MGVKAILTWTFYIVGFLFFSWVSFITFRRGDFSIGFGVLAVTLGVFGYPMIKEFRKGNQDPPPQETQQAQPQYNQPPNQFNQQPPMQ